MTEKNNKGQQTNPLQVMGYVFCALPRLLFKFSGQYLRFRSQARRGARLFRKELIRQGLDKTTAVQLSISYSDGTNLMRIFRSLR